MICDCKHIAFNTVYNTYKIVLILFLYTKYTFFLLIYLSKYPPIYLSKYLPLYL